MQAIFSIDENNQPLKMNLAPAEFEWRDLQELLEKNWDLLPGDLIAELGVFDPVVRNMGFVEHELDASVLLHCGTMWPPAWGHKCNACDGLISAIVGFKL